MAKITCESCGSSFPLDRVKDLKECPVCGEPLWGENDISDESAKVKTKWYYYKEGGGMLDNTLSSKFAPLYTYEAVDMEDAEKQLKEVLPNSPLFRTNATSQTRCPRCFSTEIQIVPRKFSLLTGFATNKFDRVCVKCQKKF